MSPVPSSVSVQPPSSRAPSASTPPYVAPPLAKPKGRVVAWGPVDYIEPAPKPVPYRRRGPGTGAAPRARSCLMVERGDRYLYPKHATPLGTIAHTELREARGHYLQAHDVDPRSAKAVLRLVQTAQKRLGQTSRFASLAQKRLQEDIRVALGAVADFVTEGTDQELIDVLGESHGLLGKRLSAGGQTIVTDRLVPALRLLLTTARAETSCRLRALAHRTLALLVVRQRYAAAGALAAVGAWAEHAQSASVDELAAACEVIEQVVGTQKFLAAGARTATLATLRAAGSDSDKRALCAQLLSVGVHGANRGA